MIKPEIGMPVIYHPHPDDHFGTAPVAAFIARVWGDNCVNLMIADGGGMVQSRCSVLLHHGEDGQPNPAGGRWCQFPDWFVRLANVRREIGPIIAAPAAPPFPVFRHDPFMSAFVHIVPAAVCAPAPTGSPDSIQGCQPTSQVQG